MFLIFPPGGHPRLAHCSSFRNRISAWWIWAVCGRGSVGNQSEPDLSTDSRLVQSLRLRVAVRGISRIFPRTWRVCWAEAAVKSPRQRGTIPRSTFLPLPHYDFATKKAPILNRRRRSFHDNDRSNGDRVRNFLLRSTHWQRQLLRQRFRGVSNIVGRRAVCICICFCIFIVSTHSVDSAVSINIDNLDFLCVI